MSLTGPELQIMSLHKLYTQSKQQKKNNLFLHQKVTGSYPIFFPRQKCEVCMFLCVLASLFLGTFLCCIFQNMHIGFIEDIQSDSRC